MQPFETETYDFPKLQRKGGIYVDKTGDFHRLIMGTTALHFASRPRCFGKSRMFSTHDTIFHEPMEAHSEVMGLSYEAYREQLRFWHNGYHFSRVRLGPKGAVYNSYAISRTPANQGPAFMPPWTESGNPSVRVNDFKRNALQKRDDGNLTRVPDDLMASCSFKALSGTAIRFQCGYRTIKHDTHNLPIYAIDLSFDPKTHQFIEGVAEEL